MKDSLDVAEWIRYAEMDYNTSLHMSETYHPVPLEIVCYHCQQSAEKALKAYAIAQSEPLTKTHDLETILEQCVKHDDRFNAFGLICPILTGYAVFSRYPVSEDSITEQDMKTALKNAFDVFVFTKARIMELIHNDE